MGTHKKPVKCAMCDGKGYTEISQDGKVEKKSCGKCNGTGTVS
jgi:DnaJ-class molecular chaperone